MRRLTAGVIAFLAVTGHVLVLPVYANPSVEPHPVETGIAELALGSVADPVGEAVVVQDGAVLPEGVPLEVADAAAEAAEADPGTPATEPSPPPASPTEPPAAGPDAPEDVALSGDEVPGVHALTVSHPRTERFASVGVTWRDDPTVIGVLVQVRVADAAGSWGEWTQLEPDDIEQTPSEETPGDVRGGTAPYWTGEAHGVEVVVQGVGGDVPEDVRVALLDPGTSEADALPADQGPQDQANGATAMPRIHSRAEWGADESIRTWAPQYASTIKAATLHHTADSNGYAAADVPAILRSIYAYHARTRGWGDIGYNVIVDRFGRAFEGRYGGLASTVVGAHAGGFNSSTFGISMLGTYETTAVPPETVATVARVIGWKFSLYGVNPRGSVTLTSGGGGTARYPAGTSVTLPTIFGHRDVGTTACPGQQGYAALGPIRQQVATQLAVSAAHDPRGSVDTVGTTASGVRATGWVFDPDAPSSPVTVRLRVDGRVVGSARADLSRPDVDAAFGVGPAHGFQVSADVAIGRHEVCVVADGLGTTGSGAQTDLGCRIITFTNRPPQTALDVFAERADGTVRIAGWTFDPEGGPTELHVYDNGAGRKYQPTVARPDVQAVYPAAGPNAGFVIDLGPYGENHEVCVFVVDTLAPGNNALLGCRRFGHRAPGGALEVVTETPAGTVRVAGWGLDASVPTASIPIHVYANGRGSAHVADRDRPDIGRAFPGSGSAHGYDLTLDLGPGDHQVCAFAINIGVRGGNQLLRCAAVSLRYRAPVGSVDRIAAVGGRVEVSGWAYDPSVPTSPLTVHYYVDGRPVAAGVADGNRPDVGRAFPGVGAAHGFSRTLDMTPGVHSVCVFALNQGVAGAHTLMRCQSVDV